MPIALPRPRTQGQHDVVFDLIPPYTTFPQKINGQTVWQAEDFRAKPELWKEQWTAEQIADLERAYQTFQESGRPITAITKVRIEVWSAIELTPSDSHTLLLYTGHLSTIRRHYRFPVRHSLSRRTRSRVHPHRRASGGSVAG